MRSFFTAMYVFLVLFITPLFSQTPTLKPNAATIQDVNWAGTLYAGSLGPIIPTIGLSADALSSAFYLKSDVAKYKSGIDALHARGMKYWMNIDFTVPEISPNKIVADGQGITDTLFGASYDFDGTLVHGLGGGYERNPGRPAWRNYIIECMKRGIDAGADGSQSDGGGGLFHLSFDSDDLQAFKDYVTANSINTADWNPAAQTYLAYLKSKGFTKAQMDFNLNDEGSYGTGSPPLARQWIQFKASQILKAWKNISDSAKAYAQTKGKDFTILTNNPSFGFITGFATFNIDYSGGEYFDWENASRYPLFGSTTVIHKLIQSLGKRHTLWTSPTDDGGGAKWNTQQQIETNLHAVV